MRIATLFLGAMIVFGQTAVGMMVDVPLPQIVNSSDLIIIATVKENDGGGEREFTLPDQERPIKRWFQRSNVTIEKILRDKSERFKIGERVRIVAWAKKPPPPGNRMLHMADGPSFPNLRAGQRYLLIVAKLPKDKGYYLPPYPKNFLLATAAKQERLAKIEKIANVDGWNWGEVQNGLQLAFPVHETRLPQLQGQRGRRGPKFNYGSLVFVGALRNRSKKPVAIDLYGPDRFLGMTWSAVGSAARELDIYSYLRPQGQQPFAAKDVAVLPPGEVILIARYGKGQYGDRQQLELPTGKKVLRLSYSAKRQGKAADGTPLWQGRVESQDVEIEIYKR